MGNEIGQFIGGSIVGGIESLRAGLKDKSAGTMADSKNAAGQGECLMAAPTSSDHMVDDDAQTLTLDAGRNTYIDQYDNIVELSPESADSGQFVQDLTTPGPGVAQDSQVPLIADGNKSDEIGPTFMDQPSIERLRYLYDQNGRVDRSDINEYVLSRYNAHRAGMGMEPISSSSVIDNPQIVSDFIEWQSLDVAKNPDLYFELKIFDRIDGYISQVPEKTFFDKYVIDRQDANERYQAIVHNRPVGDYTSNPRLDATMDTAYDITVGILLDKGMGQLFSKLEKPAKKIIGNLAEKLPTAIKNAGAKASEVYETIAQSLTKSLDNFADKLGGITLRDASKRGLGSRGVRNTQFLTPQQEAQLLNHAQELGLDPSVIQFSKVESYYSSNWDYIALGPDAFPAPTSMRQGGTVFERLTPRASVAHEAGHMITTRAGVDFRGGVLLDEVQASLVGRELPGLSNVERFQLLRDAAERAKLKNRNLRDLLPLLKVNKQ